MNILETLKAKFAGNQAALDNIAAAEAQAAQVETPPEKDMVAQVEEIAQTVVAVDPIRPPARFATLCEAYDKEHGVQA